MEASMAGFGTEMLLFCALGFVVLGPKRMNVLLQHIARAKAELDKTRREIKSQLTTELDGDGQPGDSQR
jgi:Sec-independent protein translocase protein TatA